MELVLARGAGERERGAFVPWKQDNVLLAQTKTDQKGYNLLSRPPLATFYTWGSSAPVHGVFWRAGLFGGSFFAVIGGNLYRDGVSLGAINGTGPVSWAAGTSELVVARGDDAFSYNGTNLAAIAFPDSADVRAVHWMGRRFFFVRKGSGRLYFSDLDDGRTIDGLNYVTAESEQDELLDIAKQGDVFWLLGTSTGEAWVANGDPDLPIVRVVQRNLGRGVQDTGCAEEIEGTVYFITSDGMVCRIMEGSAQRVSDDALDEKVRQSTTGSTFSYQYEGKVLFCMRLDAGTYVMDLGLDNMISTFSTAGRALWAPKCAANVGSEVLLGDDTVNKIYVFDETSATDSGQAEFRREFSAGLPLSGNNEVVSNVIVQGNTGSTTVIDDADNNANPLLEMRYSRDGGKTWSPYRSAQWGKAGEYKRRARYGPCGMFGPPGFLAEFRILACVPFRAATVHANESMSGRGR